MSTRARSHRPAPWKYSGWKDAPGALPVIPIPGAEIAESGTVPDDTRSFKVAVTSRSGGGFEAHLKFCEGWAGYCVHGVSASTGMEAKALAVLDHVRRCVQGKGRTDD